MEVIARDVRQDIGCAGIHRDVVGDEIPEGSRPLPVDQDRLQHETGEERPFDDQVALGDEPAGVVAARLLALLTQGVVAQALEHEDPGVLVVVDLEAGHGAGGYR